MLGETYSVGRRVLLLSADNTTASLSSVEGSVSSDNSLALRSTVATSAAADLGGGIPVIHICGWWGVVGGEYVLRAR